MTIIQKPSVLLPKHADMQRWATVACDQFCAEPAYWSDLDAYVGDAPSTLRLVYPECYLADGQTEKRTAAIGAAMNRYIQDGFFYEVNNLILVERQVGHAVRVGLIAALDLDAYEWERVRVPIRATEDTLVERLPVRIGIREKAEIELPHTMILMDDREKTVIEPIYKNRHNLKKLYDFDLNMNGGHIAGYEVENSSEVIEKILALGNPALQTAKYGKDAGIFLAVGDGNHSMATAKVIWRALKKTLSPAEQETHPARYFLAELVNLYGGGMDFEPIHRMVFGADASFVSGLQNALAGDGKIALYTETGEQMLAAPASASRAITAVQTYIENAVKENPALRVEYVHNEARLKEVRRAHGGVAVVMPRFPANELFDYVVNVGNLPKKAFSIGEPEEKRYYLEARRIKP